jgi:hypothetical protein
MRSIDTRTATHEESDAWLAEFIAAIEDGSLRAKIDATIDPEWNAKYGDNAWETALVLFGYLSPAEAEARFQARQGKE